MFICIVIRLKKKKTRNIKAYSEIPLHSIPFFYSKSLKKEEKKRWCDHAT